MDLNFEIFPHERSLFPVKKIMQHLKGSKVGFPVWRNFYERTHVNLKGVHGIEAMSEVSRVDVKVGQDSTFSPTRNLSDIAPTLFTHEKI